jgi:anti-sigma B factor antagonist
LVLKVPGEAVPTRAARSDFRAGGSFDQAEGTAMQVTSTQLLSVPLLEVRGEIDHGNAQFLTQAIEEPLDRGESILILDLSLVEYMDSGGVSVLLSTVRRLRNRGWLGVVDPNSNVRRLLEIVGLTVDHGFRLFDSKEEASRAIDEFAEA